MSLQPEPRPRRSIDAGFIAADRAAVRLAARQHQAIEHGQLLGCGLTQTAIKTRVRRGWLHRAHRGIYVLGASKGVRTTEMAAVLACGAGSVLAGQSAAYLWRMLSYPAEYSTVEVATSTRTLPQRRGIAAATRTLSRGDIAWRDGIPVLTPAMTLLDVAARAPAMLDRAFDEAIFKEKVTPSQVLRVLDRHRGTRGARALRELTEDEAAGSRSRLEGEKRMKRLIRLADLPPAELNAPIKEVPGIRADMLWPSLMVVVEFDGFATHSNRRAFEDDRTRDARLQAIGYRVLRVTWRQLTRRPYEVVARLAAVLALAART